MRITLMPGMFAAAMVVVGPSWADAISVAGRTLNLQPPSGYCQADKNHAERPIIEGLEKGAGKGSRVLMVFAQCDELKDLRSGKIKYLRRYGQYVAPAGADGTVKPQPVGALRGEFVDAMANNIRRGAPGAGSPQDAAKKPRQYPELKPGEMQSLGLLANDGNAAYIGLIQGFKAPSGDVLKLASVGAITLLDGIQINADLFEAYTTTPNIDGLLAQQKAGISALVAKNR